MLRGQERFALLRQPGTRRTRCLATQSEHLSGIGVGDRSVTGTAYSGSVRDRPQLIIDDQCALCRVTASWLVRPSSTSRLSIVGAGTLDVEALRTLGLTRAQLADAAWLVDADGASSGVDGIIRVLATKGRASRMFGRVVSLPPLLLVARRSYRFVARHRESFSRTINGVSITTRALRAKSVPR